MLVALSLASLALASVDSITADLLQARQKHAAEMRALLESARFVAMDAGGAGQSTHTLAAGQSADASTAGKTDVNAAKQGQPGCTRFRLHPAGPGQDGIAAHNRECDSPTKVKAINAALGAEGAEVIKEACNERGCGYSANQIDGEPVQPADGDSGGEADGDSGGEADGDSGGEADGDSGGEADFDDDERIEPPAFLAEKFNFATADDKFHCPLVCLERGAQKETQCADMLIASCRNTKHKNYQTRTCKALFGNETRVQGGLLEVQGRTAEVGVGDIVGGAVDFVGGVIGGAVEMAVADCSGARASPPKTIPSEQRRPGANPPHRITNENNSAASVLTQRQNNMQPDNKLAAFHALTERKDQYHYKDNFQTSNPKLATAMLNYWQNIMNPEWTAEKLWYEFLSAHWDARNAKGSEDTYKYKWYAMRSWFWYMCFIYKNENDTGKTPADAAKVATDFLMSVIEHRESPYHFRPMNIQPDYSGKSPDTFRLFAPVKMDSGVFYTNKATPSRQKRWTSKNDKAKLLRELKVDEFNTMLVGSEPKQYFLPGGLVPRQTVQPFLSEDVRARLAL